MLPIAPWPSAKVRWGAFISVLTFLWCAALQRPPANRFNTFGIEINVVVFTEKCQIFCHMLLVSSLSRSFQHPSRFQVWRITMTIMNQKFIAAAAALATVATLSTTASACGGRSSGSGNRSVSRAVATFARPAFRTALPRSYGAPTIHRSSTVSQPYVSHSPTVPTYASSTNMIHSQPIQTYAAQPSYSVVSSPVVHSSAPSTSAAQASHSSTPAIARPAPTQGSSLVATQTVSTTMKSSAALARTDAPDASCIGNVAHWKMVRLVARRTNGFAGTASRSNLYVDRDQIRTKQIVQWAISRLPTIA